jgi:hypothetical protein
MKTTTSKLTKRTALLGLFLMGAILVNAQSSSSNDPSWTISKGVQKVANKKNFENEAKRNSQLQTKSTNQQWVVSKGVNRQSETESLQQGNVPSTGIPTWTISKAVNRPGMAESSNKGNMTAKGNAVLPISKGVHQQNNK